MYILYYQNLCTLNLYTCIYLVSVKKLKRDDFHDLLIGIRTNLDPLYVYYQNIYPKLIIKR